MTFCVALPFTQVILFTTATGVGFAVATGVGVGTSLIVGVGLGFALNWAIFTLISELEKANPKTPKRLPYGISS